MALYDSENNRLLDTNDNVLHARATFTVGTREVKKIYVGENEVKAIYIGDNLVYEKEPEIVVPQLDAPAISLDNDNLVIEEVENAEYYDIYVDGVLEESVPAVNSFSNIFIVGAGYNWERSSYKVNDGQAVNIPAQNGLSNEDATYAQYKAVALELTNVEKLEVAGWSGGAKWTMIYDENGNKLVQYGQLYQPPEFTDVTAQLGNGYLIVLCDID